jgi:hypothetical protein
MIKDSVRANINRTLDAVANNFATIDYPQNFE